MFLFFFRTMLLNVRSGVKRKRGVEMTLYTWWITGYDNYYWEKTDKLTEWFSPSANNDCRFSATLCYGARTILKLSYQFFKICASIPFITERCFPSSFTPIITLTGHVVTCSFVYTMSCALLTTINTIPFFPTFCLYKIHSFILFKNS